MVDEGEAMSVSYSKEQRADAKKRGLGLITIAWENPSSGSGIGGRVKLQGPASPKVLKYVKKVMERVLDRLSAPDDAAKENT